VIAAAICGAAFDRVNVLRFGDGAQQGCIAARVGTDPARIVFGERKTNRTELDAILDRENRLRE